MSGVSTKSYASRASSHPNPTSKRLLEIMERKKSNLALSIDVTTCKEVLDIVRTVGSSLCMVKTHCDVISDFTLDFARELGRLSDEMDFIIFEDRKFADIGNTVSLQYSSGLYQISSWAHMTNAHPIPGPGIIEGLSAVGQPQGRALLLLAEMSSKGTWTRGEYTRNTVKMAREVDPNREFVVGYIAMSRVDEVDLGERGKGEDYLMLTPGVGLHSKGDGLGQQYRTPREVIFESGCDIIIVGRGIYGVKGGEEAIRNEAERYREEGWKAYEERLKK